MKKYLLPETGNFYKANLHCHSTVSDGQLTAEEIKKIYYEKGYSVVAYTDHEVLISQSHLTDENFLALNGTEIRIEAPATGRKFGKVTHLCLIGLEPDNIIQPCWHRSKYPFGNAISYSDKVKFDETKPDWERVHSHDGITAIIKECRDNGFFVTYNHPNWSLESYPDYMGYEGMHAMEICNYNSICQGFDEHNPKEYDEMLKGGKRLYCIATDDNHNKPERPDSFGGFTMIKADKLEYRTITKALEEGNFYASEGPIINELWLEDKTVHIKCEPAVEIYMNSQYRYAKSVKGFGYPVTEASFELTGNEGYVRFTVVDKDGKRAYTNAYFIDELLGGTK